MIDIGYFINLNKQKIYNPKDDLLYKCFYLHLIRRFYEINILRKPTRLSLNTGENGVAILVIYNSLDEWREVLFFDVIDKLRANWASILTEEIYTSCRYVVLKDLIKATEKLEDRLLWDKKYVEHYDGVPDPALHISEIQELTFEKFRDWSAQLLADTTVEFVKFSPTGERLA